MSVIPFDSLFPVFGGGTVAEPYKGPTWRHPYPDAEHRVTTQLGTITKFNLTVKNWEDAKILWDYIRVNTRGVDVTRIEWRKEVHTEGEEPTIEWVLV